MNDETPDRRWYLLWALPASLILHALAATLLVYGQIIPSLQSQEEQVVSVALVPPPDQPKPEPAAPPPPAEAPKAEAPPQPKPEAPPEPRVEKPPLPEEQLPKPPQIEVLQPVFKFGDKDSGPRESPDGGSAQDHAPSNDDPKPSTAKENAETEPATPAASQQPEDAAKSAETREAAVSDTESEPISEQGATSEQAADQKAETEAKADDPAREKEAAAEPLAATDGDGEIALPASAQVPTLRPATPPKPTKFSRTASLNVQGKKPATATPSTSGGFSGLPGVRKLNSRRATGNALATTAMDDMPRDQRAARLCASELQQQLQSVSYFPDLVPLVPLKAGNVLDVPDAAFRTRTKWYGLGFRCTVDDEATEVLSFTFQVGNPIPPEQWARLGLPLSY